MVGLHRRPRTRRGGSRASVHRRQKDFDKNNKNNAPFERAKRDMGTTHRRRRQMPVQITSTTEAQNIVNLCRRRALAVPRGAGTGRKGCVAYSGGVAIDTGLMKSMSLDRRTHGDRRRGRVEERINALLEPHGFIFGPDPSPNPKIGGMASTGGSGLSTLKYGTSKERPHESRHAERRRHRNETKREEKFHRVRFERLYLGRRYRVSSPADRETVSDSKTRVGGSV